MFKYRVLRRLGHRKQMSLAMAAAFMGSWLVCGQVGRAQCSNVDDIALTLPEFVRWYIDTDLDGDFDTWAQWGLPGDGLVAGEPYAAWVDGFDEVVILRGENQWYVKRNAFRPGFSDPFQDQDYVIGDFGLQGDTPLICDFDGDGKDDDAVRRGDPDIVQFIVVDANRDLRSDGSNIVYEFSARI